MKPTGNSSWAGQRYGLRVREVACCWSLGALLVLATGGVAQAPAKDGVMTASGLWYRVRGTGEPVLLLHGSNLDSRSLSALADDLARDHRVIETDLRFHGHSGAGEGPFSFEEDARDVLDAAGVARATVIGHSLGARVAIDLALMAPSRVTRLILLAPGLGGKAPTRPPEGFEGMMAALRARDFAAASEALAALPVMALKRDSTAQGAVRQMVRDNARLFAADPGRMRTTGAAAAGRLGEIGVPVLVLTGAADPTESGLAARDIVTGVRGAREEVLAGCGHLLPIDCRDDVIRLVREFTR